MPCCPASDLLWVQITQSYPNRLRFSSLPCKVGNGGVFHTPRADFSRPVEELEYTCLLKSTFTEVSHDRGFKTCLTRQGLQDMTNISKATTIKERVVAACAESQSTSRGPNRTRFLAVQTVILDKMQCDKKSLFGAADASKKRNLMTVGGHSDNVVDLCGQDNADLKRQCLGKGQTM
jgi:hypothetical protein